MKKEFKTKRFYVQGVMENMDGIDYVEYSVFYAKEASDNEHSFTQSIGIFGATESMEYDNANVLFANMPLEVFGEIFSGYYEFLQMPIFFLNDDETLGYEARNELLAIGAQLCKDTEHETRWFDTDCYVYKLGNHTS